MPSLGQSGRAEASVGYYPRDAAQKLPLTATIRLRDSLALRRWPSIMELFWTFERDRPHGLRHCCALLLDQKNFPTDSRLMS
jgi:hypothetical protein